MDEELLLSLQSLAHIAEAAAPIKRGRGRPRKYLFEENSDGTVVKKPIEAEQSPDEFKNELIQHLPQEEQIEFQRYQQSSPDHQSHMIMKSEENLDSSPRSSSPDPSTMEDGQMQSPPQNQIGNQNGNSSSTGSGGETSAKRGRGRPRKFKNPEDAEGLMSMSNGGSVDNGQQKRKRGRPPKKKRIEYDPVTGEQLIYSDESNDEAAAATLITSPNGAVQPLISTPIVKPYSHNGSMSVRRVPCFYANCTHSYRRPNSNIIEFSDRPLVLHEKYNGYPIRSCKKHHDWWKGSKEKGTCEICRGLNDPHGDLRSYSNNRGLIFNICDVCAYRQGDVLGIPVNRDYQPPSLSNNPMLHLHNAVAAASASASSSTSAGEFSSKSHYNDHHYSNGVQNTYGTQMSTKGTEATDPSFDPLAPLKMQNPEKLQKIQQELDQIQTKRSYQMGPVTHQQSQSQYVPNEYPQQHPSSISPQQSQSQVVSPQSQSRMESEDEFMNHFRQFNANQNRERRSRNHTKTNRYKDYQFLESDSDMEEESEGSDSTGSSTESGKAGRKRNNTMSPTVGVTAGVAPTVRKIDDKVTFYTSKECPYAQKTWMTLIEKGIPFDMIDLNLRDENGFPLESRKKELYPWLYTLNPQGKVPVITHQSHSLFESDVIAEYLEEAFPHDTPLLPSDPLERARVRLAVSYINNSIVPLFYRILESQNSENQELEKKNLLKNLLFLSEQMEGFSKEGPYIIGSTFTLADIALLPFYERIVNVLAFYRNFVIPQNPEYQRLHSWFNAARMRPSFVQTTQIKDWNNLLINTYKTYANNENVTAAAAATERGASLAFRTPPIAS